MSAFQALDADVAVVAAYGLILPQGDPRCAAPWLPQHPRLAAAALARRRADPARDHGGRCRDRRHHHADGRGAGYRSDAADEKRLPIGRTPTAGELARRAGARWARALIVAALRRLPIDLAARRSRPRASPMPPRSPRKSAGIDWQRSAAEIDRAGARPVAGAGRLLRDARASASKILAAERWPARGAPGTVLDDRLTIACGAGRAAADAGAARRASAAMSAEEMLRGFALPEGTQSS